MDQRTTSDALSMLEFIAEQTSDVFVRVDRAGVITYVSPSIRAYGQDPEALVGTEGLHLFHPDDRLQVARNVAALLQGEAIEARDRRHRFLTADEGFLWVEGSPRVIFNAKGEAVEIVSVFRDVSRSRAAEEALRESESRYRLIAENMTDVVAQTDANALITYISPSIRAYGHEPADLIGRPADDLLHPEDLAKVLSRRPKLYAGETTVPAMERVMRVRTGDGDWVWMEGEPHPMLNDAGETIGMLNVLRNINERRAQSELFEAAFTNGPVPMTMSGLDGRFLRVNPATCRALGMEEAELLALSTDDLSHPDERGDAAERVKRLLSGDIETYEVERRFRRADGTYVLTQLAVSLVRNTDGSPKHFVSHIQDLSARRAAEAALNVSESRYRMIAEQTRDIIAMSDRNAEITYLNDSIRQLGFEPEDLLGKTFASHVHPDDAQGLTDVLSRQHPGSPAERVRWRAKHKITGRWVWLESTPTRLWHPETGELVGNLDIVRDITQQVRQEEALARARSEAEAAARVKSQFLANMSHEIRTPLTAVLGYSDILSATDDLAEEARAHVQRIAAGGSALLAIVNDILDFSKLEAGMVEVRLQPTDLAQVAADTLAMFEAPAAAKGLTLALDVAPDLPDRLMLDTDRLRQILVNLTGNALKFTDRGHVVLRAGATQAGQLRLEVEDTGPGLDAEQCSQLFQRFNQINGSTTRRHGGTGLGLAICKGLAEAMGGEIGVTSSPGEGSVFYVTLPLAAVDVEAAPAVATDLVSIAGLRVLVVDDNATNRELARRILEAFGADVTDADGGVEALAELMSVPVDVVLLDLRMPDMDGREVLTRLRAQGGPNGDVPVLAFTADADVGDGAGLGAFHGVVRKPIDARVLAADLAAAAAGGRPTASSTKAKAAG